MNDELQTKAQHFGVWKSLSALLVCPCIPDQKLGDSCRSISLSSANTNRASNLFATGRLPSSGYHRQAAVPDARPQRRASNLTVVPPRPDNNRMDNGDEASVRQLSGIIAGVGSCRRQKRSSVASRVVKCSQIMTTRLLNKSLRGQFPR